MCGRLLTSSTLHALRMQGLFAPYFLRRKRDDLTSLNGSSRISSNMSSPTKWLALGVAASGVAGLSCCARAATPELPNSGTLLQGTPELSGGPTSPSPTLLRDGDEPNPVDADLAEQQGPTFRVDRIDVDGLPEPMRPEIDAIVAPYQRRDLSLETARKIAQRVTQALVSSGEYLGYAYIPPQTVDNGVLRLEVMLARVEAVRIGQNQSLVSDRVVGRYLAHTTDMASARSQIEQLKTLPGIDSVVPILSSGQTPGGTLVTLQVTPSERVEGLFLADNAGSQISGRNRLGAQVIVNSPLGLGDRFQLIGYAAPSFAQFNHDSDFGRITIGRVSYDLPVDTQGTRIGMAVSRVDYTLGGFYRELGAGHANVFGLYASRPLLRARMHNLNVGATFDIKEMRDEFVGDVNKRSAIVLGGQLDGSGQSAVKGLPTIVEYQAGFYGGRLQNPDPFYGSTTHGHFFKATQNVKVTQLVGAGVYAELSANAQQASRNLDGAEKMVLAGPAAVRAYSTDSASVDTGTIASATLNWAVPKSNGLIVKAFYDYAHGKVQKFSGASDASVEMKGYGLGASYTIAKRAVLNVSMARPHGGARTLGRPSGQVWVNAAIRF